MIIMLKEKLITYFKSGEKQHEQFNVGAEFESLIVNKNDLKSESPKGMESLLTELAQQGWQSKNESVLELEKDGTTVTLKPGCQLEVSIKKSTSIRDTDKVYLDFLKDIFPLLEKRNLYMLAVGYQPASKVGEMEDSQKKEHQFITKYIKAQAKYSSNMMKGSAGTQVTIDYAHQDDFRKKFQVAYALSPVMFALFDNSPIFEGEVYSDKCLRRLIGSKCDDNRCGAPNIMDRDFGYAAYADFLMACPPIFIKDGNEYVYTGEKTLAEIYQDKEITEEEIQHAITMVCSDIKLNKFIEIRMADALPYPLNIAYVTLWKTLLYSQENLDALYEFTNTITGEDIVKANQDVIKEGLNAKFGQGTLRDLAKDLFFMANNYCLPFEAHYLQPLEALIFKEITPREITLRHLQEIKG